MGEPGEVPESDLLPLRLNDWLGDAEAMTETLLVIFRGTDSAELRERARAGLALSRKVERMVPLAAVTAGEATADEMRDALHVEKGALAHAEMLADQSILAARRGMDMIQAVSERDTVVIAVYEMAMEENADLRIELAEFIVEMLRARIASAEEAWVALGERMEWWQEFRAEIVQAKREVRDDARRLKEMRARILDAPVVVERQPPRDLRCARCQKRSRRFDDLCGRCAEETGTRPRGKVV